MLLHKVVTENLIVGITKESMHHFLVCILLTESVAENVEKYKYILQRDQLEAKSLKI